jgi:hypothetical protein
MSKEQTAVEYLLINLLNKFPKEMEYLFSLNNTLIQDTFNEAKEMEKQQIIDARVTAPLINSPFESDYRKEAEQYYNETFNK